MNPTVSVIIPVYNAENYIRRLVHSLNSQTYKNFEAIFVDDGSKDNTYKILCEFTNQYPYITILKQVNSGAPAARNKGLSQALGEYIYFCDADDELDPKTIELLYNDAIRNQSDLVLGNYRKVNYERNIYKDICINPINLNNKKNILFLSPFPGNKLIRKSILIENNISFENVKIGQDLLFFQTLISHVNVVTCINEIIYYYYLNEGSISHSYDYRILGIIETLDYVEQYYDEHNLYKEYKYELQYLRNNHILTQIFKIPFIENRKDRKKIFKELSDNLNLNTLDLNYKYSQLLKIIFWLIPHLGWLFTSSITQPLMKAFFKWYNTKGYKNY